MSICVGCLKEATTEHICSGCDHPMCEKCWRIGIETYHNKHEWDIGMCDRCNIRGENGLLRYNYSDLKSAIREHMSKHNREMRDLLRMCK